MLEGYTGDIIILVQVDTDLSTDRFKGNFNGVTSIIRIVLVKVEEGVFNLTVSPLDCN